MQLETIAKLWQAGNNDGSSSVMAMLLRVAFAMTKDIANCSHAADCC
jgi:hypothetical protein